MFNQIRTWYYQNKIYKQTIKELRSLSSTELRDLGISEWMIPEIAATATYGVK